LRTREFDDFYNTLDDRVARKLDYVLQVMISQKVISSKFVKKLENTIFYEMRISVDNEYRVILFAVENTSFIESETIMLLNGFIKKSSSDYRRQVLIAMRIVEGFIK